MSQETIEWLNTYTLQSRAVWHTDKQLQKIAQTVYDGAIPVEDVAARLFAWEPVQAEVKATATVLNADGVEQIEIIDPDRKAICRPPRALSSVDAGAILGIFKSGYTPHSYKTWLLEKVAQILDDELGIYSAGLLKGGAQAWVQVTVPETITTPEGVTFRPNLLAVTSLDGYLATTYKRTIGNTVCDNTMAAALREGGAEYRVRHTRYSDVKLQEARNALEMVHTISEDFQREVAELCAVKVTKGNWDAFLDVIAPLQKDGKAKEGMGLTLATKRRGELTSLYTSDPRVAPWTGTAWGVVQAVNTHAHHVQTVRGSSRDERNMTLAVNGDFDKLDRGTAGTILAIAG